MIFKKLGLLARSVLWALIPGTLLAAAPASNTREADFQILGVFDAYRAGNPMKLASHAQKLEGHVLTPWVEYLRLSLKLEDAQASEVRAFLSSNNNAYVSELLRGDWLKVLGRRGDWKEFEREAANYARDDIEIRCYAWLSRIARLMLMSIREFHTLPLWVKINLDATVAEQDPAQLAAIVEQWREITAEDLGEIDMEITVELASMSPVTEEAERNSWTAILTLLKDPGLVLMFAGSEVLLRKTLYLTSADEEDIVAATAALAAALAAGAPPGLIWFHHPMPDQFHDTIFRAAAPKAFRTLFAAPKEAEP